MIDKDTPISRLPLDHTTLRAFGSLRRRLPGYTYEHAVTVTDAELSAVRGVGPVRLAQWKYFKSKNPISNPLTEAETLKLENDRLRADLESRIERVSELARRLSAKETEAQNLVWQNQSLTYRLGQQRKMLDLVRDGLTVPELRRIGFTVDISIAKEETAS
jgi:regulator of replication initiation timing